MFPYACFQNTALKPILQPELYVSNHKYTEAPLKDTSEYKDTPLKGQGPKSAILVLIDPSIKMPL